MQKLQTRFGEASYNAARAEMLLPEDRGYLEAEGMEKTYKFTQEQLKEEIDITTAQKVILPLFPKTDLPLPLYWTRVG